MRNWSVRYLMVHKTCLCPCHLFFAPAPPLWLVRGAIWNSLRFMGTPATANCRDLDRPLWPIGLIPVGTRVYRMHHARLHRSTIHDRIYGVTKSRPLFILILTLIVAELAAALAMSIRIWTIKHTAGLLSMRAYVVPWLAIQTTLDILVSGNINTDSVINRLIRGAIRTGAFSTILAITGLVIFFAYPDTLLYSMFMIPIGRTYTTVRVSSTTCEQEIVAQIASPKVQTSNGALTLMNTLNVRTELKQQLLNSQGNDELQLPTKANAVGIKLPNDVRLSNLRSAPPPSPNIPVFHHTRSDFSCSTFSAQEVDPRRDATR
ncbi:hypothetical protein BKA70DRAFT_1393777 [Coprinopsis sp. MPI-PUGE-AT-0042]|nr:hypothetical protein BKA70DRAFT_1393777 [Coprinopsis sp. MPI-PUGE-AT-0042]